MSVEAAALERAPTLPYTGALRRLFSFPVAIVALVSMLGVLTVRSRVDDPDMWWHLKLGEVMWTSHTIPTTDTFSYTTNHHATIPHEWLSQLLIYAFYRCGGYSGLMLWLCLFMAAVIIAGYGLCWLYSGNAKVAFLGALTVWFFSTVGLAVRPQMIGYLLLIVELLVLHLGRTRNPRWFFALPPLFALWVNCHGSFLLGIGVGAIVLFCSFFSFRSGSLVAARWEPRSRKMLMAALLLCAAALFVNPAGAKLVLYPFEIMLRSPVNLSEVTEWRQLRFSDARGLAFIVITGTIVLSVIVQRSELFLDELLLLSAAGVAALNHERLVFAFGILAAPALCRMLANGWDNYNPEQDRPLPNVVFILASLLIAFVAFPNRQNLAAQVEQNSPVKAVEFIEANHLTGPMLNEYSYGGYLIWAAPDHPVFLDGRTDIFEWTGVLQEFGDWETLKSPPENLLDKYKISFCLLARGSQMTFVLPLLPEWKVVYSDQSSEVFVRTSVTNTQN